MNKKNLPMVSVIVATKNEEKNIDRCLKSISVQTLPKKQTEIIVIDAGSIDRTQEIAKQYTDKVFNLADQIDLSKIKNVRGAQINFGVKKARGEIIFFPDADMTFEKNLLSEAVDKIQKENLDALYIPEVVVGKGLFGKVRNFERSFYNMTPIDGVRIVTKKIFNEVGGFDEKNIAFGPDDWDFTKRVKQKTKNVSITKAKKYHHEETLTLGSYLTKKSKYGNTFDDYIKKWGREDPDVKKQLGFSYRYWGVFIEYGKWRKLIFQPHLAIAMYVLKVIVGVVYLDSRFPACRQARHGNDKYYEK